MAFDGMTRMVPNVIAQEFSDWFAAYHGDCMDVMRGIPSDTLHYAIWSPPFKDLYTFSDSVRDLSNNPDHAMFWQQYEFIMREVFRIMKPGRLVSIHCMALPTSITHDGFIGLRDFPGENIALAQKVGFIYHSEVYIRKDPVSAMQRSKAIGLLHKQVVKDSALSRMALGDKIVTFRKPGDNDEPISGIFETYYGDDMADEKLTGEARRTYNGQGITDAKALKYAAEWGIAKPPKEAIADVRAQLAASAGSRTFEDHKSIAIWQRYAEPIWTDIVQGDTLSRMVARDEQDERHISPLQITAAKRCVQIWSNPGDIVFSPFSGIGTVGYVSIGMNRRFLGAELKPSYYHQCIANLRLAERDRGRADLFGVADG